MAFEKQILRCHAYHFDQDNYATFGIADACGLDLPNHPKRTTISRAVDFLRESFVVSSIDFDFSATSLDLFLALVQFCQ